MFFALSEQLDLVKGIKISHDELRRTIVQHLRENPRLVSPLFFFIIFRVDMLWFNFILGLSFISHCFKLIIIYCHTPKQREIKFKPKIKLNHNRYICGIRAWPSHNSKQFNSEHLLPSLSPLSHV